MGRVEYHHFVGLILVEPDGCRWSDKCERGLHAKRDDRDVDGIVSDNIRWWWWAVSAFNNSIYLRSHHYHSLTSLLPTVFGSGELPDDLDLLDDGDINM